MDKSEQKLEWKIMENISNCLYHSFECFIRGKAARDGRLNVNILSSKKIVLRAIICVGLSMWKILGWVSVYSSRRGTCLALHISNWYFSEGEMITP
jgi:hypothetical protein